MSKCKLCEEKQHELDRILKAYRKDKETGRKERKKYQITILSLFGLNMLTLAFGAKGVKMVFDLIERIIK